MAPALTPEALQGTGASGTLCTTLYTGLCILISPMWGFGTGFINNGGATSRGLAQASPTIVGVWADRSVPVCLSSPMTPVPWTTGALAERLLCSALVKVAINLAIWSPSSFEPEGTSVAAADLTLTLVSSVSLSALLAVTTSFGVGGLRVTIQISDGVSDMFLDPVEQSVLEVAWHLMTGYSAGAFDSDLV